MLLTGEVAKPADIRAFRQGLAELGYAEGKNLIIDYRSADGRPERFPALAAELVSRKVDLIVTRGTPAAIAAKEATSTIPVVMAAIADPLLVVRSLARRGGIVLLPTLGLGVCSSIVSISAPSRDVAPADIAMKSARLLSMLLLTWPRTAGERLGSVQ